MNDAAYPGSLTAWLVGITPTKRTLVVAGVAGLALAGVVTLATSQLGWGHIVLLLLAFDIGAGWVSNLSQSTRSFWKTRSRALQVSYVILHLALYPVALWVLADSVWVWGFLFMALLGKVGAFVVGLVKS